MYRKTYVSPDYISAKEMRKIHKGNVYSPMGCRSFLGEWQDDNGEYKYEGRFTLLDINAHLYSDIQR